MPKLSPVTSLQRLIGNLMSQRKEHLDALAEIDAVFTGAGITINQDGLKSFKANGRAATKPAPAKRGRRRKFDQTAEEFVLDVVGKGKGLSTAEVNAAWKKSGRSAVANITLGKLVKDKRLVRTPIKDGRGSIYSAA